MENHSSEKAMCPAEIEYLDLIKRGDDFLKIQLLRPAKSWYQKALKLNIEPEKVRQKIAECDNQLAFERKVIRILIVVFAVLVFLYIVL